MSYIEDTLDIQYHYINYYYEHGLSGIPCIVEGLQRARLGKFRNDTCKTMYAAEIKNRKQEILDNIRKGYIREAERDIGWVLYFGSIFKHKSLRTRDRRELPYSYFEYEITT